MLVFKMEGPDMMWFDVVTMDAKRGIVLMEVSVRWDLAPVLLSAPVTNIGAVEGAWRRENTRKDTKSITMIQFITICATIREIPEEERESSEEVDYCFLTKT